jgi:hypothetical protein
VLVLDFCFHDVPLPTAGFTARPADMLLGNHTRSRLLGSLGRAVAPQPICF